MDLQLSQGVVENSEVSREANTKGRLASSHEKIQATGRYWILFSRGFRGFFLNLTSLLSRSLD